MAQVVETTKMSTKGQVIIPKETRQFTCSSENTLFTVFPLDRETIVLRKIDAEKAIREFRAIRARVKGKVPEATANEIVHRAR
ncbi:MAG: hypothetical protein WC634_01045 [archaeon]